MSGSRTMRGPGIFTQHTRFCRRRLPVLEGQKATDVDVDLARLGHRYIAVDTRRKMSGYWELRELRWRAPLPRSASWSSNDISTPLASCVSREDISAPHSSTMFAFRLSSDPTGENNELVWQTSEVGRAFPIFKSSALAKYHAEASKRHNGVVVETSRDPSETDRQAVVGMYVLQIPHLRSVAYKVLLVAFRMYA